jgi:choline monooxygenase
MPDAPRLPTTLPYSAYTDPAVLQREHERIFRRHWQYVGHTALVPGPGTLAACRAADVPVLLARDDEGVLRAFLNVCRHRGAVLVDGPCSRSTIQCPYHAWTYGLDGTLRSAPRSSREEGFDPTELGLVSLSVDTWGPLVFVHPDPEAAPLAETLGDLPERVASAGLDLEGVRFLQRAESTYAANWKICCENFLECYHCQIAHPGFCTVVDVSEEAYELEEHRGYSSQYGPVKDGGEWDYDARGEIARGQFHFLFPNVTINIAPGRPNLSIGPILPDGPERTSRFLDYFVAPDADEVWIEKMLAWDTQVGVEDTALVERVQRGVRAGLLDRGVLFRSERLIAHFDRLVVEALGSD